MSGLGAAGPMGVESDAQAKPEHDRGKRSFPAD